MEVRFRCSQCKWADNRWRTRSKLFQNPRQDVHETGEMKEALINGQRAIIAHHQSSIVAEPGESALRDPPSFVTAQRPTVLRRRFPPDLPMRGINSILNPLDLNKGR